MNHINAQKSNLMYFRFGPIIAHHKLNNDFINKLNKKGDKTHIDHSAHLAGHIKKENEFNVEDKDWFIENTKEIFLEYIQNLQTNSFDHARPPVTGMNLDKLWINFMKKGEFNPVHDHSGNISFVIYTSVPNEILMENKDFKGKGSGPGCISFFHGENSENYRSEYHFLPKRGYMFIFPASLRHFVPPFKSNVTRISVSGNLTLSF